MGQVYARPIVGLAAKLTAGYIAGAIGVTDRAGVLRAVYIVLIVLFGEFLALYRLARTLIRQRP